MSENESHAKALADIKQMMAKSSRFIGLSGWSGVAAGTCALLASVYTANRIECWKRGDCQLNEMGYGDAGNMRMTLLSIGLVTFVAAFLLAFLFTYMRSRKTGVPVWGYTTRKLMIAVAVPMIAGGLIIWRMMDFGFYGLIAPGCLIFYGLGLIGGAKFTYSEIRYLGYFQLLLGIINLWMVGYGLYFWALGFGILHIIYGIIMWNRYERNEKENN